MKVWTYVIAGSVVVVALACRRAPPTPRPIDDVVAIPASTFPGQQATCPPDLERVDPAWATGKVREYEQDVPVTVAAFEIERRKVTVDDYLACVAAGACKAGDDDVPGNIIRGSSEREVAVSFDNAQRLCTWRGGRLPTLAELQRALRGPRGERYPFGTEKDWLAHLPDLEVDAVERIEHRSPDDVIFYVGGTAFSRFEWTSSIGCGFDFPFHSSGRLYHGPAVQQLGNWQLHWVSYRQDMATLRCVRNR
jgi:hypothetical protein